PIRPKRSAERKTSRPGSTPRLAGWFGSCGRMIADRALARHTPNLWTPRTDESARAGDRGQAGDARADALSPPPRAGGTRPSAISSRQPASRQVSDATAYPRVLSGLGRMLRVA